MNLLLNTQINYGRQIKCFKNWVQNFGFNINRINEKKEDKNIEKCYLKKKSKKRYRLNKP